MQTTAGLPGDSMVVDYISRELKAAMFDSLRFSTSHIQIRFLGNCLNYV